jgi:hypothetical protein
VQFREVSDGEWEGVWRGRVAQVVEALASKGYSMGKLRLDRVSVDSTTVEARKGGNARAGGA